MIRFMTRILTRTSTRIQTRIRTRTSTRLRTRTLLLALASALLGAAGVYAAWQVAARPAARPLASLAPPDALLAIESPDFAALLKSWTDSAEQKRWLASDNYAGFVRSRLFERLSQAQDEFAATAGLDADTQFLTTVAGKNSLLAWYDIGNLEFLYITRMPAGQAAATPLLALRDKFEQRRVGAASFYVRTEEGKDGGATRTVAFAVRGDTLLLSTREDLLAGALQLMQQAPQAADRTLEHERWYAASAQAAARPPGALRMTLNLAKIVPSPYFRSYWVQQNITEMKQYAAAVCDLDRTPDGLREDRVLLPAEGAPSHPGTDLAPLLAFVPEGIGVYRATAQPTADDVLQQMEDKLLSRQPGAVSSGGTAPLAELAVTQAGASSDGSSSDAASADLTQRIDQPEPSAPSRSSQVAALRDLLRQSPPSAMMVFATATSAAPPGPAQDPVFHAARSAIALSFAAPVEVPALQRALFATLSARLSVGPAGLAWIERHEGADSWYALSGMSRFSFACRAATCVFATDEPTLRQVLSAAQGHPAGKPLPATVVAGFRHGAEREPFYALAGVLDYGVKPAGSTPDQPAAPLFFSGNLGSLSRTFADLDSEIFTEAPASNAASNGDPDQTVRQTVRQTVEYRWRHP